MFTFYFLNVKHWPKHKFCQIAKCQMPFLVNFIIQKLKSKHLVCLSFLWWQVFLRGQQEKIFYTYSGPQTYLNLRNGRGPCMMQPTMNEYKNPRPNPRGPKHHISCRLCYLFILQYSPTSRGVKLLSKLIIVNDRIKYKVCYPLKIYNIVFNTKFVYHRLLYKLGKLNPLILTERE